MIDVESLVDDAEWYELADGEVLLVSLTLGVWKLVPVQKVPRNRSENIAENAMRLETYRKALEVAKPRKTRGRPRKAKVTEPASERTVETSAKVQADEDKLETCRFCGRDLPASALVIHKENCAIAAAGYATHVSQPGSGRTDND